MEEYEKLLAAHPDDPVYLYLAASAQLGRNTTQAIMRLERAIERSPSFGLADLLLAQVYAASSHDDPAKVKQHLERFESACPDSIRAFPNLRWSKDTGLLAQTAGRIRRNLKDRTDSEALAAYSVLWSLEAAERKSDEQAENLARLKQDMARLFAPEVPRNAAWDAAIESVTFFQDGVDEYGHTARREMAARYPHSNFAVTQAYLAARSPNPYPNSGTPEQIAAYWRKDWQAALPVVRQFPGSFNIASIAARAIARDPSATPAEVHAVIALFLAAAKADPDGMPTLPPQPIEIAQTLAERGVVEDVPDVVYAGFAAIERAHSPNLANDVFGTSAAALTQRRDQMTFWGYNALTEAYTRLGRLSSVKDLLIQQDDILNRLRPPESAPAGDRFRFAEDEAVFWYLKGLFADHRPADALVDYPGCSRPPRRNCSISTRPRSRSGRPGWPRLSKRPPADKAARSRPSAGGQAKPPVPPGASFRVVFARCAGRIGMKDRGTGILACVGFQGKKKQHRQECLCHGVSRVKSCPTSRACHTLETPR